MAREHDIIDPHRRFRGGRVADSVLLADERGKIHAVSVREVGDEAEGVDEGEGGGGAGGGAPAEVEDGLGVEGEGPGEGAVRKHMSDSAQFGYFGSEMRFTRSILRDCRPICQRASLAMVGGGNIYRETARAKRSASVEAIVL